MSVQTATRVEAALPHVNLLPPEIGERKRLAQVQLAAGVALVATVGAVGFLYVQGTHGVSSAKQDLAAVTTTNATLAAQVSKFGDVNTTRAALDAHEAMLTQAMASEIKWSDYLGNFATLPTSTWLESLLLSETVLPGSISTPAAGPASVGTVSFKGVGKTYGSLADWLDKVVTIGADSGLADVYFTNAGENYIDANKVVDFQASTTLTKDALSARCAKPGVC